MTNTLLKFLLAGSLFVAAGSSLRAEMSPDDLMALAHKVRNGVMFMMIQDESGHTIGSGTGFIVSEDGKLITNRHVVSAGPQLVAKAPGGRTYKVNGVLAEDTDQDLVVVKLEDHSLPPLTLGTSDDVAVGTPVVIVGNPLAKESTVQQGTVSGFRKFLGARRWIEISAPVASGLQDPETHIIHGQGLQVVTSVAHGSSGSPVFNANGDVIGIISAIGHGDDGQAIALAIPVEVAKDLIKRAETVSEPKPLSAVTRRGGNDLAADPEYSAAAKAFYADDLEGALPHAQTVVTRYPDSPAAYLLLGEILLKHHASRDAGDAFERAVQLKSDLASGWAGLAMAYLQQDLPGKARDAYRELEKLDPDLARKLAASAPTLAH